MVFSKLKQIQDLRKKAKELKDGLEKEEVTSESLAGQIKIVMTGNQEIKQISISETLLSPEKKEILEKGLTEVFERAIKDVQRLMARKIQSGEINLPM
jgi:DNA-binding YbaB/EbfC family protein